MSPAEFTISLVQGASNPDQQASLNGSEINLEVIAVACQLVPSVIGAKEAISGDIPHILLTCYTVRKMVKRQGFSEIEAGAKGSVPFKAYRLSK